MRQIAHVLPSVMKHLLTLTLAILGTGVFWILDLPLPFLFGPMVACLLAALAHAPIKGFGQFSIAARTILGVAVGTSITPALFSELSTMAMSIALIPLFIGVIGLIGFPFFHKLWGFDPPTAYYAAMPGGLMDMVLFGSEAGGDPRVLSLIHATRMLIIVTLAPILLTQIYGATLTNPVGVPAVDVPLPEIILMAAAALIGWKGGEKMNLFGASIFGPMLLTAALSLAGLIHIRPPREAILTAQFFIGCGIGIHFLGVTWQELTRVVISGLTYVTILAILATIFTSLVTWLELGNPIEAFLAFIPGGQAEMTILAIVTGADLGYVITHHLARIVIVIIGAPLVASMLTRKTWK